MRILHTSDWHLGKNLEQVKRMDEQKEFIDCLCKIVDEQNIDIVLIAGDVYDTYNPSAAAEELFYVAIDRLNDRGRRAVVVIAGNHDNPERLCAASPLAYKNGIILLGYPGSDAAEHKTMTTNIKITESGPGWMELCIPGCEHNAVLITIPYPSESRLEEILSQQADEGAMQKAYSEKIGTIFATLSQKFRDDTVNLAVGHLYLLGGKESESERTIQIGGALSVSPSVLPSNAHYVALGHLHRPQEVHGSPCPAYYSGSPLAYSFSEAEHSKAVYIVEAYPGEKAKINPLYLACGKPLSRWFACEGIGQAIAWCEGGRDPNCWVDLEILTDRILTSDEQRSLRALHPGIINIRPILKSGNVELITPQNREGRKVDELFRDYYKYRKGNDISDELMAAFVEILNDTNEEPDNAADGGGQDETEAT